MNNKLVYTILLVVFIILFIFGGTYAWFISSVNATNNVTTNAKNFQVIYTGDTALDGNLLMTSARTDDYKRTVSVRVADDSVNARLNLYINIEELTANLAVDGFKWEVYGYQNGTQVYSNSGNFSGKSATSGNNIVDLTDFNNHIYVINNVETTFDVYLWLDGNMVDETVLGSTFRGYIGAKTENFTGIIKNPVTVTFDANGGIMPNLVYGLDNTDGWVIISADRKYKIENGIVTLHSDRADGFMPTTGRVYLEAGKTYRFSCDTDGVWGNNNAVGSVEAYWVLNGELKDGYYSMYNYTSLNNNGYNDFTPTVSGTYHLRLDVNTSGETHTFSNISITETAKQVVYGQSYGELPTPTRTGYTFKGWNGRNYYNVNDTNDVTGGYTVDSNDWITLDTSINNGMGYGNGFYNYFTHNLNIEENMLYTFAVEFGSVADATGRLMLTSQSTLPTQFGDKGYQSVHLNTLNNTIDIFNMTSRTNVERDMGLRTYYYNESYDTDTILTFRLSVLDYDATLVSGNFKYEPYYITSSTTVVQTKNHTLKAIWEPNS